MTIFDLREFCSKKEDGYNELYYDSGYVYGSDGCIAVRCPWECRLFKPANKFTILWEKKPSDLIYQPIPEFDMTPCLHCNNPQHTVECQECGGVGIIEWETEYNDYEIECKSCKGCKTVECEICRGTGIDVTKPVDIQGITFNKYYLLKIKDLPNISIAPTDDSHPAWFTFDGGEGCLMPMRY